MYKQKCTKKMLYRLGEQDFELKPKVIQLKYITVGTDVD